MKTRFFLLPLLCFAIGMVFVLDNVKDSGATSMNHNEKAMEKATFAGGCFWCVESDFEKAEGVGEVISGYTGGIEKNPTYEAVSAGTTGHLEAVQVSYDPQKISYEALLNIFWRHIDPTDSGGQFVDRGSQYRSAIFYHNEQQRDLAEKSKTALEKSGRFQMPIVTEIRMATAFYAAENYHQDYYKNNPIRYNYYRYNSGRDSFLEKAWGNEKSYPRCPLCRRKLFETHG